MLVATTRPEFLVERKGPRALHATPEDVARMERQSERLGQGHKVAEEVNGETLLVLVVAEGFVGRFLPSPLNEVSKPSRCKFGPRLARSGSGAMRATGTGSA